MLVFPLLIGSLSTGDKATIIGTAVAGLGLLVLIGDKVYKSGQNSSKVTNIENDIKDNIKPEVRSLRKDMTELSQTIRAQLSDILQALTLKQVSEAHSPRALNKFGKQVLEQSGVRSIIEPKLDQIIKTVKAKKPENAYQVQEMLLDVIQELKGDSGLKNQIEQAAYKSGVSVETVLLVAAIDIRDTVLERLDMKPDDIDLHRPEAD